MNKKIIAVALLIVAVVVAVAVLTNKEEPGLSFGGGYLRTVNVVGTSAYAERLPNAYVGANTTSTAGRADGGLVTQRILTTGADTVRLHFLAFGNDATSTLNVKPQFSHDGVNFFNATHASSTDHFTGTTTPGIAALVTSFTLPTATTTWSYDYDVSGAYYTRFLIKGTDDADNDWWETSRAWIEASVIENF